METIATTTLGECPPWQDLPPDLLGLILQRVPSHADRVHVRAVCRSWHAGAGLQPSLPPLLPLLLRRDGTFLSLPDGVVHRIAAPDDVSLQKSTGDMLFLVHNDGRCSLVNPFSRETAHQYVSAECFRYEFNSTVVYNIRKAVLMPDHIITIDNNSQVSIQSRTVNLRWTPSLDIGAYALDVTLFQEKLYVLVGTYTWGPKLYVMNIINDKHVILQCIILSNPIDGMAPGFLGNMNHYLIASGDRLLMVKQLNNGLLSQPIPAKFEVFEAVDLSNDGARWRKVDTLLGRALFLSQGCSQSLLAGDLSFGPREDCIYFLNERNVKSMSLCSGIYNMRDGTLLPLPSRAADSQVAASWLFPPNT
ncbi:hypothetical protein ACQ4PT_021138 [Festuca glaucescens]